MGEIGETDEMVIVEIEVEVGRRTYVVALVDGKIVEGVVVVEEDTGSVYVCARMYTCMCVCVRMRTLNYVHVCIDIKELAFFSLFFIL